ncbi:hypothetical protein ABW20_dc0104778 [Dactylellina cionopaga]|nr:hypothetical protein ABW20_dc0104778 [Dactylellina cionopaga]
MAKIYIRATPLDNELVNAIEKGDIDPKGDFKVRAVILGDDYGWDITEARRIWAFGPDDNSNILVDITKKGVPITDQVKNDIISGFQLAVKEGPICGLPIRSVRFDIVDLILAGDPASLIDQMKTATRRAIYGAFMLGSPTLLEATYLANIQVSKAGTGDTARVINTRGGVLLSEEQQEGGSLYTIYAHVPGSQVSSLEPELQSFISKGVSIQTTLDHWEPMSGTYSMKDSKLGKLVTEFRLKKGLAAEVPSVESFYDKL